MDFPGIRFIWAPHGDPLSLASLRCRLFSKRNTSSAFVECGTSTNEKFPKWVQTILKILYKWSSDQTKLNYNTGKFVEGRRKIFKVRFEAEKFQSVLRPKKFQCARGRKISKYFEARKIFKVAWGRKISKSLRPSDLEAGQENFLSAESGQSVQHLTGNQIPCQRVGLISPRPGKLLSARGPVTWGWKLQIAWGRRGWRLAKNLQSAKTGWICPCQVEIRFPVSELGPRVAQRAQVAEVSTYYNAVWQC